RIAADDVAAVGELPLQDVIPGRISKRRICSGDRSHWRWKHSRLGRMLRQPLLPCRPPRPGSRLGPFKPHFGRERLTSIQPGADTVAPPRMYGTTDDAGVVAARCQQKSI